MRFAPHARKQRQLKYLIKSYRKFLSTEERDALFLNKLLEKIRSLVRVLRSYFSRRYLLRFTGGAILGAGLLLSTPVNGQTFMPVVETISNPFNLKDFGGRNGTPTFVDLDGDGDMDMMTGNHYGNFFYFENEGTNTVPQFATAIINPFGLSDIGGYSSPTFVDLDGDGDMDMLSGANGGNFFYFENIGTRESPQFAATQENSFGLSDIRGSSTPTFVDLDGDGDMDLLSGELYGRFFYFENEGTNVAPQFAAAQVNSFGLRSIGRNSTPTFVDLDGDGDMDLLSGSNYGNFHYFENTTDGGMIVQFAAAQENLFGLGDIGSHSAPTFADLDGDGDMDMMSGDKVFASFFHYFENTSTGGMLQFVSAIKAPFDLLPILEGDNTSEGNNTPTFVDLDGDGDMDLLSGNYLGNFRYFENTTDGGMTVQFAAAQENPFGLADIGRRSTPTFADLDGDGDMDLLSGDRDGNFHYFENEGTNVAPQFAAAQVNPFGLSDIGFVSTPTFADLDGDGDIDLLSGESNGNFRYFENEGTNVAPQFAAAQENPFGLSDIGRNSTPAFVDLDGDGDIDLLSGESTGNFRYFENTSMAGMLQFAAATSNPFGLGDIGNSSAPAFADLDGDGDMDMFSGNAIGSFSYFELNGLPTALSISDMTVAENSPVGTAVGTLSATDDTALLTYSLVSGSGDTGNDLFSISGTELQVNGVLDYETKQDYSVRINVNDGLHDYAQALTIAVTDENEAPTALVLSANTVLENSAVGTAVGTLSATDPEGASLTYSLVSGTGDTDNDLFSISGTELQVNGVLDYETKQDYSVRINVNDGANDVAQVFTIMVTDENEAPTALSLSANAVPENSAVGTAVGMLSATDPEGASLTYSLVSGTGDTDNDLFSISGTELQVNGVLDYETKTDYSVRVNVNDGANDVAQVFTIMVTDENEAPTALSLSANAVPENSAVGTAVGMLSATDPEGASLTYSLVSGSGDTDNGLFSISGTELQVNAVFDYETKQDYSVRINVNDGANDYAQALTITVSDENEAPTALSLSANAVAENSAVGTAIGSLTTTDVDANSNFTYSLVSGSGDTDNDLFIISGTELQVNGVLDYETKTDYSVRINVNDGLHDYAQVFTIAVTDVNEVPTALSLSANAVAENSPVGTAVGMLSATDPEGASLTYSLVSGTGDTDNDLFSISGTNLQVNGVLDYETKTDYSVRINVNDGVNDVAQVFTIAVSDENEAPTALMLSNSIIFTSEVTTTPHFVGDLTTTDVDASDSHSYTLVAGTGDTDNAKFALDNANNNLLLTDITDIASILSYTVRLRTTDGGGLSYEQSFTITVSANNNAPTSIQLSNSAIPENSPIGTLVGNLTATDEDAGNQHFFSLVSGTGDTDNGAFTLNGETGTLSVDEVFDYETKTDYSVRINVNDGANDVAQVFTIMVTDENEAPTALSLSANAVPENSAVGTAVGMLSATDPEGASLTYSLVSGTGDTDNDLFSISGTELQVNGVLDYETKTDYSVRVNVNDGANDVAQVFTIMVTDENEAPTALSLSANAVPENSAVGTAVGMLSATDPEGASLTYSLVSGSGDTDNGLFSISGTELQVNGVLDYETKTDYSVRVNVNDGANDVAQVFTIAVTDENETPTALSLSANAIAENSAAGTAIGSLTTTDVDANSNFTYSLVSGSGDTDNDLFIISGTELQVNGVLDYETKTDYSVRINVNDGANDYAQSFTVAVTDEDEAPTALSLSANAVVENSATGTVVGMLSATDPEDAPLTYSLVSGTGDTDNDLFSISGTELQVNGVLDYETKQDYSVRINVNDGANDVAQVFTIAVTDENETPTALSLSANAIAENSAVGTAIGSLTTTDVDANSNFTYSLVSGSGDTDNDLFIISGTELQVNGVLDYETKTDYSVRINVNDGANDYAQSFTIAVTDENEAPTALMLSNSIIFSSEVTTAPHFVGDLTTTDVDASDSHSYTLVAGTGDADNVKFALDNANNNLLLADITGISSTSSYTVRLRTTDVGGLFYEQLFTITVSATNNAPTSIQLSNSEVAENSPIGTLVGNLTATDEDAGNQHFFSLVSGTGDTDNGAFTLNGETGTLSVDEVFDYETKTDYSVRINVNDGTNDYAQALTITVIDVNEAPTDIALSNTTLLQNSTNGTLVGQFTAVDVDAGSTHTFSLVSGQGDASFFSINTSSNLVLTDASDIGSRTSYTILVEVNDGANTFSKSLTLDVNPLGLELPRGFAVYPNPVSHDGLRVELGDVHPSRVSVEVLDVLGRRQFVEEYASTSTLLIPTASLVRGLYVLRVLDAAGETLLTTRFVKR